MERVTQNLGWSKRSTVKGKSLGLAAHRSFLSYAAVVASVVKRNDGTYRVDEVWVVLDAGTIINHDRVVAQMEGSFMKGMHLALYGCVSHKNGRVEQNNFHGVKLVRMVQEPRKMNVETLNSDLAPGGVGELGVPPIAPAVAHALFALTGKRVRSFPLLSGLV